MKKNTATAKEQWVEQVIAAFKNAAITSSDMARIVVAALENKEKFAPEDIALCTTALMDKLRMLPLQDTIFTDPQGEMFIRGKLVKSLDMKKSIIIAARSMQNNIARKLVREKVEVEAITIGMRRATTIWDIVFGQAALWFAQQEDKIYAGITGQPEDQDEDPDE